MQTVDSWKIVQNQKGAKKRREGAGKSMELKQILKRGP